MPNPLRTRHVVAVIMLLCFGMPLSAQVKGTFYESTDKIYRLFIPPAWQSHTPLTPAEFAFNPPDDSKVRFNQTRIYLENEPLGSGQTSTLDQLVAAQKSLLQNIATFTDEYAIINNKRWWKHGFLVRSTKLSMYRMTTIHNNRIYSLNFIAKSASFDKSLEAVLNCFASFMFYTKDHDGSTNPANQSGRTELNLKSFEGKYQWKHEEGLALHVVEIAKSKAGQYSAIETRELLIDGVRNIFVADLQVDQIDPEKITLSTDSVISLSKGINWVKAVYQVKKTPDGLSGKFSSKNEAFTAYDLALVNLSPAKTLAAKQVVIKKKTESSQPDQTITISEPSTITYDLTDPESGEMNESFRIKKSGGGKVSRSSKTDLKIVTTTGKSVLFKDHGSDDDDSHVHYKFLGFIPELNCYVIETSGYEIGYYTLVNKSDGTAIALPKLEFTYSADKKWAAVFNTDIITNYESSFVSIFSMTGSGLKEVFKKTTFDIEKNSGWGTLSLKWIDNNTLEVNKATGNQATEELTPAGQVWITRTNSQWVMTPKKPQPIPEVTVMPSSEELPFDDGQNQASGNATQVPSADSRKLIGGTTPDNLGQVLLTALKKNDKKTWHLSVAEPDEKVNNENFDWLRNSLKMQGLTDWNLVKFSRVTYSEVKDEHNKPMPGRYRYFKIEFTYGTEFVGTIGAMGGSMFLLNNKYVLRDSDQRAVLVRK